MGIKELCYRCNGCGKIQDLSRPFWQFWKLMNCPVCVVTADYIIRKRFTGWTQPYRKEYIMPCSCDGYPPSPCYGDLLGSAEDALKKVHELEQQLSVCQHDKAKLAHELEQVKAAFKIMGNGG